MLQQDMALDRQGRKLLQCYSYFSSYGDDCDEYDWSGGRIAGIVVAAIVFVICLIILMYSLILMQRRRRAWQAYHASQPMQPPMQQGYGGPQYGQYPAYPSNNYYTGQQTWENKQPYGQQGGSSSAQQPQPNGAAQGAAQGVPATATGYPPSYPPTFWSHVRQDFTGGPRRNNDGVQMGHVPPPQTTATI